MHTLTERLEHQKGVGNLMAVLVSSQGRLFIEKQIQKFKGQGREQLAYWAE